MALPQRYLDAITTAVDQAKGDEPPANITVIAKFDDGPNESFTIFVSRRTVTLEAMGQYFSAALRKELLAELSRQTGVKYESFPYIGSIGYDFTME